MALGITRSRARQWMNLEDLLLDFPKIRVAFLEGQYSTHRVRILVQAAERAAMNAKPEPSTGGGDSAGGEDGTGGDGSTCDGDGVPQPDSDGAQGQTNDDAADGDAGEADRVDGGDADRDAEVDAEGRGVDGDDAVPTPIPMPMRLTPSGRRLRILRWSWVRGIPLIRCCVTIWMTR